MLIFVALTFYWENGVKKKILLCLHNCFQRWTHNDTHNLNMWLNPFLMEKKVTLVESFVVLLVFLLSLLTSSCTCLSPACSAFIRHSEVFYLYYIISLSDDECRMRWKRDKMESRWLLQLRVLARFTAAVVFGGQRSGSHLKFPVETMPGIARYLTTFKPI